MSNATIVDVSNPLSFAVRHGKFRINRTNKNLDKPRAVREQVLTTCISLGSGGDGGRGMQFAGKKDQDLWGRK